MKIWQYFVRFVSGAILRLQFRATKTPTGVALYFKDDAIGDFLFGTAVLRELAANYSQVYVVCTPILRKIAELYLPAEQVLTVDVARFNRNLFYRLACLRSWLKFKPELVVMSSCRSSFVDQVAAIFKGRAPIASTDDPAKKKTRRRHLYSALGHHPDDHKVGAEFLCGAHEKEHRLIEAAFGRTFSPERTQPFVPTARLPLPALPATQLGRYFCFLPDTGDARRTYPFRDMLALAAETAAKYDLFGVVLSARQITYAGHDRLINLSGQTSIEESLRFIAHSKFVLTNETGLGHAAWMMNRPTVMIMPGGNFGHFHAKSPALLAAYDQRPCFNCHHHCEYDFKERFPCIADITVGQIKARIAEALSGSGASPLKTSL